MKQENRRAGARKPLRPNPSQMSRRLAELKALIQGQDPSTLRHPDQDECAEWAGADVRITSDFEWEPKTFVEVHDLLVRTRHAKALTWLLLEVRDAFSLWLDASNKYGFYGSLAEAALDQLARHLPEPEDGRPLLRAVLERAYLFVALLRAQGGLPDDAPLTIHTRDAEGRQRRIEP